MLVHSEALFCLEYNTYPTPTFQQLAFRQMFDIPECKVIKSICCIQVDATYLQESNWHSQPQFHINNQVVTGCIFNIM